MKPKTEPKTKPKDPNEARFYRFATALMAVPKTEIDKEPHKHSHQKPKQKKRN
jgi:hypothetical protein